MSVSARPLRKLGFLTIGLFDLADPYRGHAATLELIELGERLGFDSAWVRHRHLQYGISSPVAVLAAASQRASRIELGTAVIPLITTATARSWPPRCRPRTRRPVSM
ncbi:MAG TPA: LLM class flavin-dependent oxidoreductase [Actinocrinis sp.]|nr:LLM class flavin-dependent oxidoreductase [Actinocrinis sp.]HZP52919.1 LLM class flavin-dependent oxidoreductase [Actinocrinis sp.]